MNPITRLGIAVAFCAASGTGFTGSFAAEAGSPSSAYDDAQEDESETVALSESNIMYFFESRADFRSPLESMARIVSSEYRDARDEFTRQELLEKLKLVIERKVAEAAESDFVSIRVNWSVPEYDFQRAGFSTGLTSSTYLPFRVNGFNFAVGFKGMKPFGFLSVDRDTAALLQKQLANSRRGYYELVGRVTGAEEQNVDGQSRKTVFIRPTEVRFYAENDKLIGTVQAPSRK